MPGKLKWIVANACGVFGKVTAITLLSLLALCIFAAIVISEGRTSLYDQKKEKIKAVVDIALGIVADLDKRAAAGEMTLAQAQDEAKKAVSVMRFDDEYYVFAYDPTGVMLASVKKQLIGSNRINERDPNGKPFIQEFIEKGTAGSGYIVYDYLKPGASNYVERLAYVAGYAPWKWVIGTGVLVEDVDAAYGAMIWRAIQVFMVIGGLLLVVTLAVSRSIVVPIRRLSGSLDRLAGGDFEAEVSGSGRVDEIGEIARAVVRVREAVAARASADMAAQEVEREQIRAEQNTKIEVAIQAFQTSIQDMLHSVTSSATLMQTNAQAINNLATEAAEQASAAAGTSERASGSVQTVAAATEELSASIREIGRQVTQAADVVRIADAKTGRSIEQIGTLATTSEKIGAVVGLIQAIAGQTNLLALNATIEAARAGEAGKGFAVVAQEVKALAAQTAKATAEIAGEIEAIQSSTRTAVTAVQEIGNAMGEINEVTATIASAVEQQGAATKEIAANVQSAAEGNAALVGNISSVSDAVAQASHSSTEVFSASGDLAARAELLSEEVERFFHSLRTGILDQRKYTDPNYAGPERRQAASKLAA